MLNHKQLKSNGSADSYDAKVNEILEKRAQNIRERAIKNEEKGSQKREKQTDKNVCIEYQCKIHIPTISFKLHWILNVQLVIIIESEYER